MQICLVAGFFFFLFFVFPFLFSFIPCFFKKKKKVALGEILQEAVTSSDSSVKQAAFGLIGDLARHCFELLPGPALLSPIVDSLYGSNVNLCMNASWALGELAARVTVPKEVAEEVKKKKK